MILSLLTWATPWLGIGFFLAAAFLLFLSARNSRLSKSRTLLLVTLRAIPLITIALLLARPALVDSQNENSKKTIALLMDRSESMSLKDDGNKTRYADAVDFVRATVLPVFQKAGYHIHPMLFDGTAEKTDGAGIVAAAPAGKATDLGAAISSALTATTDKPVAIVALTDGASNVPQSNRAAVNALLAAKVPFTGIGFGTEHGVQTLYLREVEAPKMTPPKSKFRISARIEAVINEALPAFELVLLRDGKFHDKRRIEGISASRFWSESFEISESEQGTYNYQVQLKPAESSGLIVVNDQASATVRVTQEQELRVLYMQGSLAWDYKFIGRALRNDPSIHITGLSRTSERSVFRQNVETPGELINGFPSDLKELACFRVVVLANLKPELLTPQQQEIIARYCSELGGGVLMIGGRGTFDASWRGSKLEQLLPVKFDDDRGVQGLDSPFQLKLTSDALADPVFEIDDPTKTRDAWQKLPPFDDYGRVSSAKPGATIWAVHSADTGPDGKPRILIASQSYGSGMTAVLTVQNFWKWRLAKECDQSQFDRFWQQFIRRLAESGRGPVRIEVLDQELSPGRNIVLSIEKMPDAKKNDAVTDRIQFRVRDGSGAQILEQALRLQSGQSQKVNFVPEHPGIYTLEAADAVANTQLATRSLEIRAPNLEMQRTSRDMETLKQWAMFSSGSAWSVESARADPENFANTLLTQIESSRISREQRTPIGINPVTFTLVLIPLCVGWVLRKRWMLT